MHVGSANPRWRGKRSRHSRRMRNPPLYVSGKTPIDGWVIAEWLAVWPQQGVAKDTFKLLVPPVQSWQPVFVFFYLAASARIHVLMSPPYNVMYVHLSVRCKQPSPDTTRCSDQSVIPLSLCHSFFWRMGHGRVVSTLASVVGVEMCLWDPGAPSSKLASIAWSNTLTMGIYPTASAPMLTYFQSDSKEQFLMKL